MIVRELNRIPEDRLDRVLAFLRSLPCETAAVVEAMQPALAAEPVLARGWMTPEEDAAWAHL